MMHMFKKADVYRQVDPEECAHLSWSGDEGPIKDLGRWPRRWKCDTCGIIRTDQ